MLDIWRIRSIDEQTTFAMVCQFSWAPSPDGWALAPLAISSQVTYCPDAAAPCASGAAISGAAINAAASSPPKDVEYIRSSF